MQLSQVDHGGCAHIGSIGEVVVRCLLRCRWRIRISILLIAAATAYSAAATTATMNMNRFGKKNGMTIIFSTCCGGCRGGSLEGTCGRW